MRSGHLALLAAIAASPALPVLAQDVPTFQGVGFLSPTISGSLANRISKDGNVVVGESLTPTGYHAFRWTARDGISDLGLLPGGTAESVAYGVSADGSVIVGQSDNGLYEEGGTAFRWSAATGMQPLGSLGGPTNYGYAFQTSDDGSIIMGSMDDGHPGSFGGIGFQAFRWTAQSGIQRFGQAPGGIILEVAVISGDGSMAWAGVDRTRTYRWTLATGWVQQPTEFNTITWIRDDGQVMFISRCSNGAPACPRAYRWTAATGFVDLGIIHGSSERGDTSLGGISADGSVAVGIANFDYVDGGVPFIWDTTHGIRNLQDVLVNDYGLAEAALWGNLEPSGLSADGLVICGTGFSPEGYQAGWVANLRGGSPPPSCPPDFNADGALNSQDFFDFLAAFFGNSPYADFNADNAINSQDFFDYLSAFFAGC